MESLAVIISSIAVLVAVYQTVIARHESRRTVAMTLYKSYLDSAMSNPRFALVSLSSSPSFEEIRSDREAYVSYEFYVASLLFAAESILEITKNDVGWQATLRDQLRYHADYLRHDDFECGHYSNELKTLINQVIEKPNSTPDKARKAPSGGS